ncbi:long-chain-acyl-CoA synthetase, partial [Brevundimonas sp.]
MGMVANIKQEIRFVGGLLRLLKRIKPITLDSDVLICDDIEEAVDKYPDNIAFEDETRKLTYREFEALANRYANWAAGRNLKRGDTIALMMHNRVEYVAAWFGFAKVGVATALINNNLTGPALAHCLNISGAFNVVSDEDCWKAVDDTRGLVDRDMMLWVLGLGEANESNNRRDFDNAVRSASSVRPQRSIRKGLTNRDTALYIFTSGTTGLPKAARITHTRARTYMRAFAGATGSTQKDVLFNVLPLYHSTGGLVGVGSVLLNGGRVVTRRRFSATHFWPDVKATGATMFVYIGELCRYLVNSPQNPDERAHKLRLAFGNGLRPDVWEEFQGRFNIGNILEFYGSTEGNVSLFNFGGKAGAIGRVPGYLKSQLNLRIIELDDNGEPVRLPNGLCKLVRVGDTGEAIGVIGSSVKHDFTGYADKAATQKKVLTDVFKKGDRWFRTGDLMRQDKEGYVFFMDRLGDTFRWKGENVSTAEVEQHLSEAEGVQEVIAYGVEVPGQDGKGGMVALVLDPDTAFNA